jgi:hypothetical protein
VTDLVSMRPAAATLRLDPCDVALLAVETQRP